MKDYTQVTMKFIPPCDLPHHNEPKPQAYADCAIAYHGNSWAYVCKPHFDDHGCSLGLGFGQELIQAD